MDKTLASKAGDPESTPADFRESGQLAKGQVS